MVVSREQLAIPAGPVELAGELCIPGGAIGTVVFVHGSGSSRLSPRNRHVADMLHEQALATLLFDLLTTAEEQVDRYTHEYRFAIDLLSERLVAATRWLRTTHPQSAPIGYFGSSTGAAAALVAAAELGDAIGAVVSRGGRPDLANAALANVQAPTLLLVGGRDPEVMRLNQEALEQLVCKKELVVVPGATHLFEEPGTLDAVATHAAAWLARHLRQQATPELLRGR